MQIAATTFFQKNKFPILLILALLVGGSVFVYFYVSAEKAFYVWDDYSYYHFTSELYVQVQNSFGAGLHYLINSTNQDYNVYYALPLLIFFFIAGNSRQVYEVGLVVVYLIPFILVTGLIGRKLLENKSRRVFWLVVGVAILLPTVWLPTLRGYPDTAAALAVALATLVYLKDPSLKRMGQLILFGILVGLAVLFRRHFAYTALSFFGASGVVALVQFAGEVRSQTEKALRHLLEKAVQLTMAVGFALLTLTVLNPQTVLKILFINYNSLYSSYLVSWGGELGWFLESFGWLPFGLAIMGLYLLWRNASRKPEALFFVSFGLFELLFWVIYVRQISTQYTLHLSMFVVVGLAAFLFYGWQALKTRVIPTVCRAATGLGVVLLVINLFAGVVLPSGTVGANFFSGNWQPLERADYQQVINLAAYLDQQTSWEDPIYMVASSYRFNSATLLRANEVTVGAVAPTLNLLITPDIDSRDFYPLDPLLEASLVVIIDPLEYHIAPDQQQVVKVVYDMFLQNQALAQDFAVLNPNFVIDAQTKAIVYKRVKPTTVQTAFITLQMIQNYVKTKPGAQLDWVGLDLSRPIGLNITPNRGTKIEVDRSQWSSSATPDSTAQPGETTPNPNRAELVYVWSLSGQEKFRGKVSFGKDDCGEATADFSAVQTAKSPVRFAEFKAKPGQGQDFEVNFSNVAAGQFVLLQITPPDQPGCAITLDLDPVK